MSKASKKLTKKQRQHNYGYYIDDVNCCQYKGTFEQWLKLQYADLNQNK